MTAAAAAIVATAATAATAATTTTTATRTTDDNDKMIEKKGLGLKKERDGSRKGKNDRWCHRRYT